MTKLIHLPSSKAKAVMRFYQDHIQQYLDAEDAVRAGKKPKERHCYMCDADVILSDEKACAGCPLSNPTDNRGFENTDIYRQKFSCMNFIKYEILDSEWDVWLLGEGYIPATIPEIHAKRDHILSQIEKYVRLNRRVVYVEIPKEYTK